MENGTVPQQGNAKNPCDVKRVREREREPGNLLFFTVYFHSAVDACQPHVMSTGRISQSRVCLKQAEGGLLFFTLYVTGLGISSRFHHLRYIKIGLLSCRYLHSLFPVMFFIIEKKEASGVEMNVWTLQPLF